MDDDVAESREALQWAQNKLTLPAVLREWASLGALITIGTDTGQVEGYAVELGSDWVGIRSATSRVYVPARSIEHASASRIQGPPCSLRTHNWLGVLRSFEAEQCVVGIQLRSRQQLVGLLSVVAQDHVRLLVKADEDGALGPIVPFAAISYLTRPIRSSRRPGQIGAGNVTSPRSLP